jgi:SAM-dependent methyltransferase
VTEPLAAGLARVRAALLDDTVLVRAVGSGRRRVDRPSWRKVEVRYVDLRAGRVLQVTAYDETQAHTSNHAVGADATAAVDGLLAEPFGNWHVETSEETTQLRVTKRLQASVHTVRRGAAEAPERGHDRAKPRLLPEDHPVLAAVGIADHHGRVKPSRQAKYRQVEELLRALDSALDDGLSSGRLRTATAREPLRVVDLGCGNAYLTFAAHAYLADVRNLSVRVVGVDVRAQSRRHNQETADRLGVGSSLSFVQSDIATFDPGDAAPDVVLALHACDTATDDALARAVEWQTPVVLAAPCCHHDIAAQLRRSATPAPYSLLTRSGILRERFADTLTDALRAGLLRQAGYRVEVVEFVESKHTPRNTLLSAIRTGAAPREADRVELDELTTTWGVRPRLAELLGQRRSTT